MAAQPVNRSPILLASRSTTRRKLLEDAGLAVECRDPALDERLLEAQHPGEAPDALALRLAAGKAGAVAAARPDGLVVGADQVLEFAGSVLHKPRDVAEARDHLARLSGRTHLLHAAVAIAEDGAVTDTFVETARLTMRPLAAEAIAAYVALAGPARVTSSVGAYQIEGLGIHLFSRIEGDHSTILGLPLLPLLARLRQRGWLRF